MPHRQEQHARPRRQGHRGVELHPNLHARHLAAARAGTIGVIVSNLENPFFLSTL